MGGGETFRDGIGAVSAAQAERWTAERAGASEDGWMPFENEAEILSLNVGMFPKNSNCCI